MFSFKQKIILKPHRSIYHAELSKYAKFHKNPLQTHGNMGLQTFYKEMYARATGFREFATDSYETSHIY